MTTSDKQRSRIAMLDAMIDKGSDDPFVHYARALESRSIGELGDAAQRLAAVRDRFPAYVPTYLMAAQIAETRGELEEAHAWTTQGIAQAKAGGDAHAESVLQAFLAELDDQ